jgi:hypothetical protein
LNILTIFWENIEDFTDGSSLFWASKSIFIDQSGGTRYGWEA